MRVIPGSFGHMLHEVKVSESNPPLYYVLAWGWTQAFGRDEWGIRSLSALFGTLTVRARLPDRQAAGEPPRRPHPRRPPRLQPDADLVLAGGPLLRAARLLRRALLPLLPARPRQRRPPPRTGALGGGLGARPRQPLLRLLRGRDRGGLARGRAAPPLEGGAAGARRGRRRGRRAAAADRRADEPEPHRLDRRKRPRRALLPDRGQLPDRRNRPRDRRAAARPLRGAARDRGRPRGARPARARHPARAPAAGRSRSSSASASSPWRARRRSAARTTWSSATCCRRWSRSPRSSPSGSAPRARGSPGCWSRWPSAPTGSPSTSTSPRRRTSSGPTTAASRRPSARPGCRARSSAGGSPATRCAGTSTTARCAGSAAAKRCGKSTWSASGTSPSARLTSRPRSTWRGSCGWTA